MSKLSRWARWSKWFKWFKWSKWSRRSNKVYLTQNIHFITKTYDDHNHHIWGSVSFFLQLFFFKLSFQTSIWKFLFQATFLQVVVSEISSQKYDVREQKWKISATDKQKSTIQKRCLGQSLTVSVSKLQCHDQSFSICQEQSTVHLVTKSLNRSPNVFVSLLVMVTSCLLIPLKF